MDALKDMTIGQIIGDGAGVLIVLSLFFEIAPIKFNPVSSLLKWLGGKMNTGIGERLTEIEKRVDSLDGEIKGVRDDADLHNAQNIRIRILQFADELRIGVRHSQEHFDQMLEDIDNYERYCMAHPNFKNSKATLATKLIEDTYTDCVEKNSFL